MTDASGSSNRRINRKSAPPQPGNRKHKESSWSEVSQQLSCIGTNLRQLVLMKKPGTTNADGDLLFRQDIDAAMTFLTRARLAADDLHKDSQAKQGD